MRGWSFVAAWILACTPDDGDDDRVYGLDARPDNATCVLPDDVGGVVQADLHWESVSFERATAIAPRPDGDWYVLMREGRLYQLGGPETTRKRLVLDLSDDYSDLGSSALAIAVHPDFANNGYIYIGYPTHGGSYYTSRISRFTVDLQTDAIDPDSELVILDVDQTTRLHSHGDLRFAPDGTLYLTFGDGGESARAQDPFNLHGKILRIDVDSGQPYGIPSNNPFADGVAGAPEVYAYGLRNPWRITFDPTSGDTWTGDVGLLEREEVDRVVPGANYGWPIWEGTRCNQGPCPADDGTFTSPVGEYDHTQGAAIIIGPVYRGQAIPALQGKLIVSDWVTGAMWAMATDGTLELISLGEVNPVAFAETPEHEVIALAFEGAFDLLPRDASDDEAFPARLSETGCMDPTDPALPGPGLVPYEINTAFWSDGAAKTRWVAMPNGAWASVDADGQVIFPPGTVLVKAFERDGVHIETRLLVRQQDGRWAGHSYAWDEAQDDAVLKDNFLASVEGWPGQAAPWLYPSTMECTTCHNTSTPGALGPKVSQLAREVTYAETGRTADQLDTWRGIGLLAPSVAPVHPLPEAAGDGPVEERARAWLDVNCSFCHHPDGPTTSTMDLRYETPLAGMNVCGVVPSDDLGLDAPSIVAPGDPDRSVLVHRIAELGPARMPPLASNLVDEDGAALVRQWVTGLPPCP